MSRVVRAPRRLPGLRFEDRTPAPLAVLPRMDVAALVGFAASGPIDVPVAVESPGAFAAVFGDDPVLAWDPVRGEAVTGLLGPAVRAFFRNGGRRCWVVRVADRGKAVAGRFALPGLARRTATGGFRHALAPARSEGSWSDGLSVAATTLALPIPLEGWSPDGSTLDLRPGAPGDVRPGDVLRLTFASGHILMVAAGAVTPLAPEQPGVVRVDGRGACWFLSVPGTGILAVDEARTADGRTLRTTGPPAVEGGELVLGLAVALEEAPPPGSVLELVGDVQSAWLTVAAVEGVTSGGSPPSGVVRVRGRGLQPLVGLPSPPPAPPIFAERLTLSLEVRAGNSGAVRLDGLGLAPGHPRYWGDLPDDASLYAELGKTPVPTLPPLWTDAAATRFPLAGADGAGTDLLTVPVGPALLSGFALGALPSPDDPLTRDGLATFDETLFLDGELADVGTDQVVAEADFLRYQSPSPRRLRGVHAVLDVEEATLVAVPDAVQRGWVPVDPPVVASPPELSPPARPEWWHALGCLSPPAVPLASQPPWDRFLDCGTRVLPAPHLTSGPTTGDGSTRLAWTSIAATGVRYTLVESPAGVVTELTRYSGTATSFQVLGRGPGRYVYHVRAEAGGDVSDWSPGVVVVVAPGSRWQLRQARDVTGAAVRQVHLALLRMCAARGDLLAVLALPDTYREDDALAHADTLRVALAPGWDGSFALPTDGEGRAASFGALYHPWLEGRDEAVPGAIRRVPPDGAACGVIARRAIERGAWIAPCNEPLNGTLALDPPVAPGRRVDLLEGQVNAFTQEPRGFVALGADTLHDAPEIRPVHVRRLLMLLRRLALSLGAGYVFEPNNAAFRRRVQRGFEAALGDLYTRGAFDGATASAGFQVVTGGTVNTPTDGDAGRFLVELRVAPAQALTTLTVRLVMTGDRTVVTEGP